MEPPEQELALRRLRRIRLITRLVVYGGLVLVLVPVLLGARRDARTATASTWLDAETSQGHPFELMLRHGRPVHFATRLDAPCAGRPWQTRWWEREGRGVPFRFDGDVLTVESSWPAEFEDTRFSGRIHARLRAQIDDGHRFRGYMQVVGKLTGPYGPYGCDSGRVSFVSG